MTGQAGQGVAAIPPKNDSGGGGPAAARHCTGGLKQGAQICVAHVHAGQRLLDGAIY